MYTTTLEKLVDEMYQSGYVSGAQSPEIETLDSIIVERLRCKWCGGTLVYLPFCKKGSYRPFTICNKCGDLREF